MITIILENSESTILGRVSSSQNESYLLQIDPTYRYLSELSGSDIDVFGSGDMSGLIEDLSRLRKSLVEGGQMRHIDLIIDLAKQCEHTPGCTLTFTPWGEAYNSP